jgi:hypothetical protein
VKACALTSMAAFTHVVRIPCMIHALFLHRLKPSLFIPTSSSGFLSTSHESQSDTTSVSTLWECYHKSGRRIEKPDLLHGIYLPVLWIGTTNSYPHVKQMISQNTKRVMSLLVYLFYFCYGPSILQRSPRRWRPLW